jgi:transglutaminase-like putative cysteine protease
MQFKVNVNLDYQILSSSTLILNILAHARDQKIKKENLQANSKIKFLEPYGSENRIVSIATKEKNDLQITYEAIVDTTYELFTCDDVKDFDVEHASAEVLSYLNPSRYCQSDLMYQAAGNMFASYDNDYDKVAAITDWIYNNIKYISGSSNEHTTAIDSFNNNAGVCRDFAHLGITFCRALTIPARYFTCYAYQLYPKDFHACFEAYINGQWMLFDATKLAPINGFVKIAVGRDAADVPVANIFGIVNLLKSEVFCETIDENFKPLYQDFVNKMGISFS